MPDHYATPCEVIEERTPWGAVIQCGKPSVYRYAAMRGGWMHLCEIHGHKHRKYSEHVTNGPGEWLVEMAR